LYRSFTIRVSAHVSAFPAASCSFRPGGQFVPGRSFIIEASLREEESRDGEGGTDCVCLNSLSLPQRNTVPALIELAKPLFFCAAHEIRLQAIFHVPSYARDGSFINVYCGIFTQWKKCVDRGTAVASERL
jgi:hypothetical protein